VTLDMMILHGQAVMRVKIESGSYAAETISYLVERGIPVMSHVGLRPQSMNVLGGFRARGRTQDVADEIVENAIAAAEAGSFAVVVEGTSVEIAEQRNMPRRSKIEAFQAKQIHTNLRRSNILSTLSFRHTA